MTAIKQAVVKHTRVFREENKGAATVTTVGNLMDLTAGLAVDATSSSTTSTLAGICNEAWAAADATTQVLLRKLSKGDTYIVDSTNNSSTTHNGQLMVVGANAHTINNTGTTNASGVCKQVDVYGATTDNKIIVEFVV
jgi:hypothetical protein